MMKLQKEFYTAECLLQGSVYYSVNHNLSLILITDTVVIYIFLDSKYSKHLRIVHVHNKPAKVNNDTKSVKAKMYFQSRFHLGSKMELYGPMFLFCCFATCSMKAIICLICFWTSASVILMIRQGLCFL